MVDQCPIESNPKCVKGHIDLSKAAFLQLGEEEEGYLGARAERDTVTWNFIPCETNNQLSLRLKEPDNLYWNEVLVENSRYPIAQVELYLDAHWVVTERTTYNYFQPPNGEMGQAPYLFRITDMNGSAIEQEIDLLAGRQTGSEQFSCAAQ